ncbi:MAG TPA: MarR family transcriptional regulator [Verrucomicrobiae bacterium]|nr:MarR family transcriptional regulator [Verrucomicrobiae bacterium]
MNTIATATRRRYEALLQLLRTSETIWNASRLFFARWELSPSQFNILNLLGGHADGLTQTALSQALITHRSNVTGLVDRLEKRGLLVRKAVPGDRRAYSVQLTKAGAQLVEEILPEYYARAEAAFEAIPLKELPQLNRQLAEIDTTVTRIAAQLENQ